MQSKDKIRVLEALEERMKIEIDNLSKKVQFFKASTLKATHATDSQVAAHCSLIETSHVKEQLQRLMKQVRQYKEVHRREKDHILQQVCFFYSNIRSVVDIMSVRIREEGKKNNYLINDVSRLTRDLEHLKKINEDFSVRLKESRSLSRMASLQNTVDPTHFESQISNTHRTHNTQFLMNANHMPQEVTQRTARSTLTQQGKSTRMERYSNNNTAGV